MDDHAFGDLLREFRLAAGLSQETLAERARLSSAAVSALERNIRRGPQQQTLTLLSTALALPPEKRALLERAAHDGRRRKIRPPEPRAIDVSVIATNVARPLTSFHGRDRELRDLDHVLQRRRLISLVGAGGVGKTRLARESALRQIDAARFPDGVWFIDVSTALDRESIVTAICHALGVTEAAGTSTVDRLQTALETKRLLLILDNCEHLVHEVTIVAETFLRDAQRLTIMVTSRESLRAEGECTMRVEPLPVDANGAISPAAELFIDRLIDADYSTYANLDGRHDHLANAICRRLDGLPLALELAAGRAGEMPLEHIARSLDERFSLLADGRRTAVTRHQTLYNTIRWSFDLLSSGEQRLFMRLGLFADTFAADAATELCGEDIVATPDTLGGLVAKSLLGFAESAGETPRYRLLESTRAFALEQLRASGEFEPCVRRLIHTFVRRAKAADASFGWISKSDFRASVEADLENFRAALEWSIAHEYDVRAGAELAGSMGWIFRQQAFFNEGARWAQRALAGADDLDARTVGRLHMAMAYYVFSAGEMNDSLTHAMRAADAYRTVGANSELAWALTHAAYCAFRFGLMDVVRTASDEAVRLARSQQDDYRLGAALNAYALTIPFEHPDRIGVLEEAIACYRACGSHDSIVPTAHLAAAYHDANAFDRALTYGREVVEMARASRDRSTLASALANYAAYALSVNDIDLTYDSAYEALELVRDLGKTIVSGCALQHLGSVAARRGQQARATRLLGATTALYREFGYEREWTEQRLYDATVAEIRGEIGEAALARGLHEGVSLDIESAIAEGLLVEERAHI